MTSSAMQNATLDRRLATFLQYGTWIASATIAVGMFLRASTAIEGNGSADARFATTAVTVGVAAFIVLPMLRLVLMLFIFFRQRDYCYTFVVALVLLIVGVGCAVGVVLGPVAG